MKVFDDAPWIPTVFKEEQIITKGLKVAEGVRFDLVAELNEFKTDHTDSITLSLAISKNDTDGEEGPARKTLEFDDCYVTDNGSLFEGFHIDMVTLINYDAKKFYIDGCISQVLALNSKLEIYDDSRLHFCLTIGRFITDLAVTHDSTWQGIIEFFDE